MSNGTPPTTTQRKLVSLLMSASGLLGTVIGAITVCVATNIFPPDINELRVYQEQGKPGVIRAYRNIGRDGLYVESESNVYVPLKEHLAAFTNRYDAEIETLRLKKQANW